MTACTGPMPGSAPVPAWLTCISSPAARGDPLFMGPHRPYPALSSKRITCSAPFVRHRAR